ncbi:zinc finger protein 43-like isoform X2 [Centruroides sculpturatus]|uniref:zinc finger protein 43-like isoform X2 n=1 Tax=Centruroides sculpturatus TaxID=218467 RepID=UPI000C6E99E0|nr:zinc finger protein 43-like isoform X2 [Centruroides sculpturatus]
MPTCFVPGCKSGYKSSNEKRHFFRAPSDKIKEWMRFIPRDDRMLTNKCYVCDVHFASRFILKTFSHVINGEKVEIPRDRWELTSDAYPSNFPNCPKYISRSVPQKPSTRCLTRNEQPSRKGSRKDNTKAPRNKDNRSNSLQPSTSRQSTEMELILAQRHVNNIVSEIVPEIEQNKVLGMDTPGQRKRRKRSLASTTRDRNYVRRNGTKVAYSQKEKKNNIKYKATRIKYVEEVVDSSRDMQILDNAEAVEQVKLTTLGSGCEIGRSCRETGPVGGASWYRRTGDMNEDEIAIKKKPEWDVDAKIDHLSRLQFEIDSSSIKAERNSTAMENDLPLKNGEETIYKNNSAYFQDNYIYADFKHEIKKEFRDEPECTNDTFTVNGNENKENVQEEERYLTVKDLRWNNNNPDILLDPKLKLQCKVICEKVNFESGKAPPLKSRQKENDVSSIKNHKGCNCSYSVNNNKLYDCSDCTEITRLSSSNNEIGGNEEIIKNVLTDNLNKGTYMKNYFNRDNCKKNYKGISNLIPKFIIKLKLCRNRVLKRHLFISSRKKLECYICKKTFSYSILYGNHLFEHSNKRTYPCNVCKKQFFFKCYFEEHKKSHIEGTPFSCSKCKKRFKLSSELVKHRKYHFKVKCCSKVGRNLCKRYVKEVKSRKLKYSKNRLFLCEICGKIFHCQSYFGTHLMYHSDKRPFECKFCRKSFKTKACLKVHKEYHSYKMRHSCKLCGKQYKTKYSLKLHQDSHSNIRAFQCKLCTKSFNLKSILIMHQKVHSDVRSFLCEICGKTFKTKQNLIQHQKSHSKERSFPCKLCTKTFKLRSMLMGHQNLHLDVMPFSCEICGKVFKSLLLLIEHNVRHANSKPFECEICLKHFKVKSTLISHIRMHATKA